MAKEIDDVLNERGARYGEFKDHAKISQLIKDTLRLFPAFKNLRPSQKEALEMMAHKIARVLNGDPNYQDNWTDIAGYARLVEKELEKEGNSNEPGTPANSAIAAKQPQSPEG